MAQNHKRASHSASNRRPTSKKTASKRSTARPRPNSGIVFDPKAAVSPLAREAQRVFEKGVRAQMADLAKKGVATVVVVNGQVIRGVPRLVNGRYVVTSGAGGKAAVKGRGSARKR